MVPKNGEISLDSGIPDPQSKITLRNEKWNVQPDIGRINKKKSDIGIIISFSGIDKRIIIL